MKLDPTNPVTALRDASGHASQAAFGKTVGMAPQNLHRYESGQRSPTVEWLRKAAEACGFVLEISVRRNRQKK